MEASLLIVAARATDQQLTNALRTSGYTLRAAPGLADAVRCIVSDPPSAVLIVSGNHEAAEHCAVVRALGDVPIIVAGTGLSSEVVTACLDAGADTALRLPIPAEEVDARVRMVLRRALRFTTHTAPRQVTVGELHVDLDARAVQLRGRDIALSPTEFNLLAVLAESQGNVVATRDLLERVWGEEFVNDVHYVRLYVGYLRSKLEENPQEPRLIVNQWGVGYRLVEPSALDPRAAAVHAEPMRAERRAEVKLSEAVL